MKEQIRIVAGLSCVDVLERLSAYLDGDLSAPERAAVEAHLRQCPNCARFGSSVQAVLGQLQSAHPADADLEKAVAERLASRLFGCS